MEYIMLIYLKPPKRPFYPQRFAVFIALIFPSFAVFLYISILKIPKPDGFFKVDGDSSTLYYRSTIYYILVLKCLTPRRRSSPWRGCGS